MFRKIAMTLLLIVLLAWLALVVDAGLSVRASPIPLPLCLTSAEDLAMAQALAKDDAIVSSVRGLAAARMLRYINGIAHSELHGEVLVFTYFQQSRIAIVHVSQSGCIMPLRLTLDFNAFVGALRAAYAQPGASKPTINI